MRITELFVLAALLLTTSSLSAQGTMPDPDSILIANDPLPQVLLLGRKGCDATVTLAHSRTRAEDLIDLCSKADILVACAGQARMITAEHVKPGAAVIDVGISRTEEGLVGDVDFEAVKEVAGWITPMPGGTGPMTIACLMENTLAAARMQGAFPN